MATIVIPSITEAEYPRLAGEYVCTPQFDLSYPYNITSIPFAQTYALAQSVRADLEAEPVGTDRWYDLSALYDKLVQEIVNRREGLIVEEHQS